MPVLNITAEQLAKASPVSPGTYAAEIVEVAPERRSKKNSCNVQEFTWGIIAEGPEMGKEIRSYLTDTQYSAMDNIAFCCAVLNCKADELKDEQGNVNCDPSTFKGKQALIEVVSEINADTGKAFPTVNAVYSLEGVTPF